MFQVRVSYKNCQRFMKIIEKLILWLSGVGLAIILSAYVAVILFVVLVFYMATK